MTLVVESVRNFRDYGGLPTTGGRRIVAGQLFRSAHFAEVDAQDAARLGALNVGLIVDLRRKDEREMFPNLWPISSPPMVVTCDLPQTHASPSYEILRDVRLSLADVRRIVHHSYHTLPFEPRNRSLIGSYIEELARSRMPSIVHCVAGKDRTGFVTAVIQSLLGASQSDIRAGYLVSNELLQLEERLPSRAAYLSEQLNRPVSVDMLRSLMGVSAENLDAAFATVWKRLGSVENYVREFIGVDATTIDALRRNCIFDDRG